MSTNPFEPPETALSDEGRGLGILGVERDCLVTTSCTQLPHRCVVTNSAGPQLKLRKRRLLFASETAVPHLWAPSCFITYALDAKIARSFALRRFVVRAMQFSILISMVTAVSFLAPSVRSIFIPATAFVIIALSFIPLEPLWLERFDQVSFWIRGCHRDFLEFIQESELGRDDSGRTNL